MPAYSIKNIVVLMLENRAFDHMLGYLPRSAGYPIESLKGDEFNLLDPGNPASPAVRVNNRAKYQGDLSFDPYHDTADVNVQLFGASTPAPGAVATNSGFVFNYAQVPGNAANAPKIMNCFDPAKLPALTTLAKEFRVCDHWYSSVPGQTWPNRFFVHAATSDGWLDNEFRYYGMRTIYDNLQAEGISWKIYFHDVPHSLALARLQSSLFKGQFKLFSSFKSDAQKGALPAYSFIEPAYFDFLWWKANDQHPDHDVSLGDALIADVYEALRNSPQWNQSLLIILWDEHGGIFDHCPPPSGPPRAVNPDGENSTSPAFNFDRLGVRVPAVLVSPYIGKGTLDQSTYDHTSILAMVKNHFNLPAFLTQRDAAAATFDGNLLDLPRTDAPTRLPRAADPVTLAKMLLPMTADKISQALGAGQASQAKLSEFQQSLVTLVDSLDTGESPYLTLTTSARLIATEHEAAVHTREIAARFLGL